MSCYGKELEWLWLWSVSKTRKSPTVFLFYFNKAKHTNTEGEAIVVTADYNTHDDVSNPCIETARPTAAA